MTWAKAIALHGVLDRRANALLALRTGYLCGSGIRMGRARADRATRGRAEPRRGRRASRSAPAPTGGRPATAPCCRAADDLHRDHTISDATWSALRDEYGDDDGALLEVAFVCGHYTMLSMVANTVGVAPEAEWQSLPHPEPTGPARRPKDVKEQHADEHE